MLMPRDPCYCCMLQIFGMAMRTVERLDLNPDQSAHLCVAMAHTLSSDRSRRWLPTVTTADVFNTLDSSMRAFAESCENDINGDVQHENKDVRMNTHNKSSIENFLLGLNNAVEDESTLRDLVSGMAGGDSGEPVAYEAALRVAKQLRGIGDARAANLLVGLSMIVEDITSTQYITNTPILGGAPAKAMQQMAIPRGEWGAYQVGLPSFVFFRLIVRCVIS